MRIGIVSRSWFTETKGGAERYIYELTKGLIGKGHTVISISRENSDLSNEHITIKSSGMIMLGSALFSIRGSKRIKELEFDVLIINQYWAEMTTLLVDVPCITILHDVGLYESEIAQSEKIRHFFRKAILKRTGWAKPTTPSFIQNENTNKKNREETQIGPFRSPYNGISRKWHHPRFFFRIHLYSIL